MKLINIGFGNMVAAGRLVAIVSPESAPIKRIIQDAKERGTLIDATYGRRTRAVRTLAREGDRWGLGVQVRMDLLLSAGSLTRTDMEIAAQIERGASQLIAKLQAAGSDVLGFGRLAARQYRDIPSWEASGWAEQYAQAAVTAQAQVRVR